MKHTPGPWNYEKETGRIESARARIASINAMMTDEGVANGHLIAAAPDLLEACRLILEHFATGKMAYKTHVEVKIDGVFHRALQAAVARAEGKL